MTVSEIIRPGDKVDISFVQKHEHLEVGEELPKTYKSQVLDLKENGNIEISMPSEAGRLVLLPLSIRLELVFFSRGGLYRAIGQIVERYKSDNVYMLEIEFKSQLEKYQRREFFRYPCVLDVNYYMISEEEYKYGSGDAIFIRIRENKERCKDEQSARIIDLSGGGVRFYTDHEIKKEEYVLFELFLENESINKHYYIVAKVINCIRSDKIPEMQYEVRAKFLISDNNVREEIIRFIFEEERKTRQRGRW